MEETPIFSVSRLQRLLRRDLERTYSRILVEGEISNLTIHQVSGHAYFTLKDESAQLRCVMWRDQIRRLRFRPENGQQVICTGKVTVYERGGSLQLSVTRIELEGVGALQAAYRQLAEKLRSEGLTAASCKQTLPLFPKTIGVVTSRQAAALKDILRTIFRRDQRSHVIIAPTPVQGESAAPTIAASLRQLDEMQVADVIILARGGGSVEDLWCFNEEVVARAIAQCQTPVVTGIGHETDTTIADLVADHSASTPSAAAEQTVPLRAQVQKDLQTLESRLRRGLYIRTEQHTRALLELSSRLQDPRSLIRERSQQFDDLLRQAEDAIRERIRRERQNLSRLSESLMLHSPKARQIEVMAKFSSLIQRQEREIHTHFDQAQIRLARLAERLELLSPLSILGRGYAIAHQQNGQVIRKSSELAPKDQIIVQFHEGSVLAMVEVLDP